MEIWSKLELLKDYKKAKTITQNSSLCFHLTMKESKSEITPGTNYTVDRSAKVPAHTGGRKTACNCWCKRYLFKCMSITICLHAKIKNSEVGRGGTNV